MAEGVLRRTMRVLAAFTEDEPAQTAAELARHAGLSLSTAHRLLAQLVEEGVLARAPGRRYTVGMRLWEIGELSPFAHRLREVALPHMVRLYEATGENVHLAVLDDPTPATAMAVFAGRLTGRASVPTLGRSGGRHPLHTTGVGKALLTTRDQPWLDAYLEAPLIPETRLSITDPTRLRADIARSRIRGYATTREEMTLGNISVAAPLGSVPGLPATALGVVAHLDESQDDRRLGPLVMQAAKDLTRALRQS
ncbi:IclR family transcriptional regulator [Microbacterium caowuchunii]|uniref:Glycerol operon regulatory protein n=1 Tax=Microbacterium caowuchunii TaxID=2614638 RepID=A0A5J6KZ48_9MICO|nr:IclR family transcriptional regulator [Microbacterium caowuchunii]KAA9132148.1 IclR family transcriptional regulator [Microbacterium caowuchunii]QEW01107.1 IclR family transcriptional regulator [Microbacterium caowuchunii]